MNLQLGVYQHYKGNLYQIIGFARHTETQEELVVYQALYGNYELWVRPIAMFLENLIYEDKEVLRFKYVDQSFTRIHPLK
jgi:hypothetical protein